MLPELPGADLSVLADLRAERFWVAFSGGLDSTVLLHWLAAQRSSLPGELSACHVDHGLQENSPCWAQHCEALCRSMNIPFRSLRVAVTAQTGESPEAAARRARYQALGEVLQPGEVLLTAHHQDDQAETLLLQLFRGAGPAGLSAMAPLSRFGTGWLCRPLLGVSRNALRDYASRHGLSWVEDPSNADTAIPRNWLRQELLPQLRQRWPGVDGAIARSAGLCGEAAEALEARTQEDLRGLRTDHPGVLSLDGLEGLAPQRQRTCLYFWLRELGLPPPGYQRLNQIVETMIAARADAQPRVRWPGGEVRRFRGRLYASTPLPPAPVGVHRLAAPGALSLAGVGRLCLIASVGEGLAAQRVPESGLRVWFRGGGERFRGADDTRRRTLKQLFQTWGLSPWERERVPLVGTAGQILAVGDRLAADCQAGAGEKGWMLTWQRASLFVNV